MRMNFFAFMFVLLFVFPFVLLGCLRGIIGLTRPISVQSEGRGMLEAGSVRQSAIASTPSMRVGDGNGKCNEGCCVCGGKPVANLFAMHYRSWRLCREHLSQAAKFVDEARRSVPNTFIALTVYDYNTIKEVALLAASSQKR